MWWASLRWTAAGASATPESDAKPTFTADTLDADESQTLTPRTLDVDDILALVSINVLLLPEISKRETDDKSKADSLVKAIACLQAGWLAIQCAGRTAQRLPTSTLELATLGYVCCTIITYCFWWHKPLGVMVPTIISPLDEKHEEVERVLQENPRLKFAHNKQDRIANNRYLFDRGAKISLSCVVLVMLIFGGVHLFFHVSSHSNNPMVRDSVWAFSFK